MSTNTTFSLAFIALSLVAACNGPIENAVDCHGICKRYESCFDSSYDVGACEERCRGMAGSDDTFQHDVDQCATCIDDQSCTSATFDCATQCSDVVP